MERKLNMPGSETISQQMTIADRVAGQSGKQATLFKRPRIGENTIQALLFVCGAISIFTTIGIVYVLISESLHFFVDWGRTNSNKSLVVAVDEQATRFEMNSSGVQFTVGQVLFLEDEEVLITEVVDSATIIVERGYEDTLPIAHPENTSVYIGEKVTLSEYFTGTVWQPQAGEFGVLPLLTATIRAALIAMLVAVPLGLAAAVYLSEYASTRVRNLIKPILELLAGVPTVVYGYFALTFMTPLLRGIFGVDTVQVYNVASAGIVMGIMIIPTIASMSEDAMSAVPRALREASYGLGGTRLETVSKIVLPAALSGIIAAVILGISRAVGETMILAVAAGAGPKYTGNPFEAAETITGHIARISTGDLSYGSIDYTSLFSLGLTLFAMTLILNLISGAITRRFRETY